MPRPSLPIDVARSIVEEDGYKLLGGGTSREEKLVLECPNGHEWQIRISNFKAGRRCRKCFCEKLVLDHDYVAAEFAKEGYKLLDRYERAKKKMLFECSNGHTHSITWDDFRSGYRCGICYGRYLSKEQIRSALDKEGYELLDDYVSANKAVRVRCKCSHEYSVTWGNFYNGRRCPRCAGKALTEEEKKLSKVKIEVNKNIKTSIRYRFSALEQSKDAWKIRSKALLAEVSAKAAEHLYNEYGLKPKGWHIDHIVPSSYFDLTKEKEILACWHPANLRYLQATANIKRSNKLTEEEVSLFNQQQLEILAIASNKPKKWVKYIKQIKIKNNRADQLSFNLLVQ